MKHTLTWLSAPVSLAPEPGAHYRRVGQTSQVLADLRQAWAGADLHRRAPAAVAFEQASTAFARRGDFDQAASYLDAAAHEYGHLQDQGGEARCAWGLAHLMERTGRHANAIQHFERALAIVRALGDRLGESVILTNLGNALLDQQGHQRAIECFQQAWRLASEHESDHMGWLSFASHDS